MCSDWPVTMLGTWCPGQGRRAAAAETVRRTGARQRGAIAEERTPFKFGGEKEDNRMAPI